MSKLVYATLGASALVAVASLGPRVIEADTLSGSSVTNSSPCSGCPPPPPPPDCTHAVASPSFIWPPDHTMVPVAITVPGAATVNVTTIQQDEPVETPGSGNTEPDGSVVTVAGVSTASVRAERAGPGTGRIYFIYFTATGANGATCPVTVVPVCVPHDQGQGLACIDTGLRFDSTKLVD